jgi:hypothetical protein
MDELLWLINQCNRPAPLRATRPAKPGPVITKSEPITYVATRRKSQQQPKP